MEEISLKGFKKSEKHTYLVDPRSNGKQINWDPVLEHDKKYYNRRMEKERQETEIRRARDSNYLDCSSAAMSGSYRSQGDFVDGDFLSTPYSR